MSYPRLTAVLCAAVAMVLGLVVLLGWAIHSTLLIQVIPEFAPMQRNTAISFVFAGAALWGMVLDRPRLIFVSSAGAAAIAVLSLLEYALRLDLLIDRLLGAAYVTTKTSAPGRMSPTTALCFLTVAAGV